MQLLAQQLGGGVANTSGRHEYGPATIEVAGEAAGDPQVFRIFAGIDGSAGGTEQAQTGAPEAERGQAEEEQTGQGQASPVHLSAVGTLRLLRRLVYGGGGAAIRAGVRRRA